MKTMIDARSYGKALFELAQENQNAPQVRQELQLVQELLKKNPEYITLMDTPAVPTGEKCTLLHEAFSVVDGMLHNFLSILCEKRSFFCFHACAQAFYSAYDEANDILRATAVTAVAMNAAQLEALKTKLAQLTGKHIELTNQVDPAVLGGVTLRYAGVQIDDSIQSRLQALRRSLTETIV